MAWCEAFVYFILFLCPQTKIRSNVTLKIWLHSSAIFTLKDCINILRKRCVHSIVCIHFLDLVCFHWFGFQYDILQDHFFYTVRFSWYWILCIMRTEHILRKWKICKPQIICGIIYNDFISRCDNKHDIPVYTCSVHSVDIIITHQKV